MDQDVEDIENTAEVSKDMEIYHRNDVRKRKGTKGNILSPSTPDRLGRHSSFKSLRNCKRRNKGSDCNQIAETLIFQFGGLYKISQVFL